MKILKLIQAVKPDLASILNASNRIHHYFMWCYFMDDGDDINGTVEAFRSWSKSISMLNNATIFPY